MKRGLKQSKGVAPVQQVGSQGPPPDEGETETNYEAAGSPPIFTAARGSPMKRGLKHYRRPMLVEKMQSRARLPDEEGTETNNRRYGIPQPDAARGSPMKRGLK